MVSLESYFLPHAEYSRALPEFRTLLRALGDPQQKTPAVLVAGTNGKGSVCAMTAAILRAGGYRVGLFTSPALTRVEERFCVDGREAPRERILDCARRVAEAEAQTGRFGGFHRMTACALSLFAQENADIAVLEVGLGGRLDPTNAAEPIVTAITRIGLDHTAFLGDTLQLIAREKCGILRPRVPLVLHPQEAEARDEILRRAAETGADVRRVDELRITPVSSLPNRFTVQGEGAFTCALPGAHQRENAAAALRIARALPGFPLPAGALREGIEQVRWPCRMEYRSELGILLDGAHNPQGVRALRAALADCFPGRRVVLILSVMRDKAVAEMLELFAGIAEQAVVLSVSPRSCPAETLRDGLKARGVTARVAADPAEALRTARALPHDIIVAAGSLYLAGALRGVIAAQPVS